MDGFYGGSVWFEAERLLCVFITYIFCKLVTLLASWLLYAWNFFGSGVISGVFFLKRIF